MQKLSVCLFVFAFAGSANSAIVDFESFAAGTEVTTQLSGLGVEFSSGGVPAASQVTNILNFGGSNILLPNGPATNHGGTLYIDFNTSVFDVSSDLVDVLIDNISIQLFDSDSNLLGTTSGITSWSFSSTTSIARVQLDGGFFSPTSPDGWGIDNLSFSTASPVPVPASVWLFGSGLLGLIGVARRKIA